MRASDTAGRGVGASAPGFRMRWFAAPREQPRARRGTDVVILVGATVALGLAIAAYPPSASIALPNWIARLCAFFADLLWLWALVLVVVAFVRLRIVVIVQALAAFVVAALVALASARLAVGSWPAVDEVFRIATFPEARTAEAMAAVVTIAPHLARPVRSSGRWVVALGLAGSAVAGTPLATFAAAAIAFAAAAAIRLASGTSIGRPGLDDVAAGLAQLGITPHALAEAERQVAGVFHVRGIDDEGRPLLVKVYGRDAYDTQLVARVWRRLWYRNEELPIHLGRLAAVEHEAFVTLLVRAGGLPGRDVVTAARTTEDDALLVLRGDADPLPAEAIRAAWDALGRLDDLKIAHQQIDPETIVIVDGDVGFVDYGAATVAPTSRQLATDRAQLLTTTASIAGSAQAIAAAVDALGPDGVAELLPYLQSAALPASLRRIDVDELRAEAAAAVGVPQPDLAKLRTISVRAIVQILLFGLAAYTIAEAAAGVDWGDVLSTIGDASWAWIVFAFAVAQLPRVSQAISTLGSVPTSLPFGPVYAMQLATGYMNVALPSNLARMAVNVRFFQRQGLSAPTAVASGVVDSFASTVVQAILLAVLLVFSESSLPLDLSLPSGGIGVLLWILVGVLVAAVVAFVAVRRLRNAIVTRVRRWWPDVRATLSGLRASHKLALLLFGSLATELLFALALGLFAHGFDARISLVDLLVINISVSLLASIVPVPGGIGVAEFGLTVGLTSAGMTPETAIAAVLLYRIATYYLPPAWGFPAMLWLQRNRYL